MPDEIPSNQAERIEGRARSPRGAALIPTVPTGINFASRESAWFQLENGQFLNLLPGSDIRR
jgi:hypothetical protein